MFRMKSLVCAAVMILAVANISIGVMSNSSVFAAASGSVLSGANSAKGDGSSGMSSSSLETIIGNVVNILLFVVGVASVVMIIYSGIRFITSGGNAQSAASARNGLLYSVIGLVVAIIAYAIVNWVLGAIK